MQSLKINSSCTPIMLTLSLMRTLQLEFGCSAFYNLLYWYLYACVASAELKVSFFLFSDNPREQSIQ